LAVREYHATQNATHRVIAGSSLGGLASTCAALRHPGAIGNVIGISSSLHAGPPGDSEPEWASRFVARQSHLPVRFFIRVGLLETITNSAMYWPSAWPTLLVAHRHLRDVLLSKGYDLDYAEFYGGHELMASRALIAAGLQQLLR
jgi:enterochelin esterase-like enzyme